MARPWLHGLSSGQPSTLLIRAMTSSPDHLLASAPTLETDRLVLRSMRRADLDALAEMLGDPVVARHLAGEPATREESWRKLMMAVGQWPLLGFGYWAVERRDDGRLVGQLGFGDFERGLAPDFAPFPEMGWIFHPSVHGQGIALEAGEAALTWLEARLGPTPVWAIIAPDNIPSLKLAAKLGFDRVDDEQYHDETIAIVHRPASV